MSRVSLSILILLILFAGTLSSLASHQTPSLSNPVRTSQAPASRLPILGVDCGLGAKEAVLNGTGFPVAPSENGAYETSSSCTWIGDLGNYTGPADKTTEPLVSDQDETLSTSSLAIGGGFTADIVYLQNGTSTLNGFDVSVSWNTSILHAITIDQGGTNWGALGPFTAAKTIDNSVGQAHLVQVVFASYASNFTLFRIRFDVVGVGNTGLTLSKTVITNPAAVAHQTISGSFNSESFFDPTHTLNWNGGFTVTPTPLLPGFPTTFTSTILCPGCTGPLHYAWDLNTAGVVNSIANPATITIPTPTLFASRVALKVTDSAIPTHNATIVERLPLTAIVHGAASLPVNTAAAWNGIWLGGIGNYGVSWRFCPGSALSLTVCSKPAPTVSSQAGQNNTQTLSGASPGYHFSGVYNVTMKVTDAGSGSVPASTVIGFVPANITGGTPVYTVQVTQQNTPAGSPIAISTGVAYSASYPTAAGFRSTLFKYTVYWGDGSLSVINAGLSTSASHTYPSAGTYSVRVVAQDLQTASQIQETGLGTVTQSAGSGFDYSLSLNPSQASVGSSGGTISPTLVIVNTITGTPQTVSLKAISPSAGITVSFNATTGLPPFASKMTVSVSPSTLDGSYTIVVQGNTTSNIAHQVLFHLTKGSALLPVVSVFSSQYDSGNITDTSLVAGSTFQVQVNVTNAPIFNAYELVLYYDQNYLNASSFDLATGTVFNNPLPTPGNFNGPGALRLSVVNLSNGINNNGFFTGGSGILARITFKVVKSGGVSPLVLAAGVANPSSDAVAVCPSCPAGSPNWTRLIAAGTLPNGTSVESRIQVATSDGYFRNVSGKSGPVASFTFSPANPKQGDTITFNATNSFDPDNIRANNHGIMEYIWDFGDLSGQANITTAFPVVTHTFLSLSGATSFYGNFSIRLTVIDLDNGFQGMKTMRIGVASSVTAIHDIGVSLSLSSNSVFQGQTVQLFVEVMNLGTTGETFDLTVIHGLTSGLQNVTFVTLPGQIVAPGTFRAYTFYLNTTALPLGMYNIVAAVSDPLDTNLLNNVAVAQLQVVTSDETPTASFTFYPTVLVTNEQVLFNGTKSADPDGMVQIWTWNFGDGIVQGYFNDPYAYHVYNLAGNYTVTLTVTDSTGQRASTTMIVQVLPRPQHDLGLVNVQAYPSLAVSGQKVVLEAIVVNTGSNSSTADLTFYYNGKIAVVQRGLFIPFTLGNYYVDVQWDTTGVAAGNYTLSATIALTGTPTPIDPTPTDNTITGGQLDLLPPPVLTLVPNSGPVGTLVQVRGSGFPIQPFQYYPVEVEVTFDNQLEGFIFIQSSSFNFSFDVPDAQTGPHQVHAVELYGQTLDVQAVFTVTPTTSALTTTVSVGTIYFPGDTATIYIMTSTNGQPSTVGTVKVVLIRPDGSNVTLPAVQTVTGLYKATYAIPATGPIGTYAVTVRAHLTGSGDGTALASFEVKPSWLSSNGKNVTTAVAITGLVGVAAFAWRRGYFKKNDEEETS